MQRSDFLPTNNLYLNSNSFLLDRLLKYENVESSSSDSEATMSSDSDNEFRAELMTLKK